MALGFLPDGKGLNRLGVTGQARRDGRGEGERVRSHRQSPEGLNLQPTGSLFLPQQIVQHAPEKHRPASIQCGHPAIHIQIALLSRGEDEMARFDGLGAEDIGEFGAVLFDGHASGFSANLPEQKPGKHKKARSAFAPRAGSSG